MNLTSKNIEDFFLSWWKGNIRAKRRKLIMKILINWTWMSLGILLCIAGPTAFIGIPVLIASFSFFIAWASLWKKQGYSLLLLCTATLIVLMLTAMLARPLFRLINYIFVYWLN